MICARRKIRALTPSGATCRAKTVGKKVGRTSCRHRLTSLALGCAQTTGWTPISPHGNSSTHSNGWRASREPRRLTVAALACLSACIVGTTRADILIWGGVEWAHLIMREQLREFNQSTERAPLRVDRWGDERNFEKFIDGQWGSHVLYHRALPSSDEAAVLKERWPEGEMQPEAFIVGHVRIAVVVHRGNPIRQR